MIWADVKQNECTDVLTGNMGIADRPDDIDCVDNLYLSRSFCTFNSNS